MAALSACSAASTSACSGFWAIWSDDGLGGRLKGDDLLRASQHDAAAIRAPVFASLSLGGALGDAFCCAAAAASRRMARWDSSSSSECRAVGK